MEERLEVQRRRNLHLGMILCSALVLASGSVLARDPDSPWRGFPTASQIPGSNAFHTGTRERVTLAFHHWSANLNPDYRLASMAVDPPIANASIRCGVAGREGALVWTSDPSKPYFFSITQASIHQVDPSSACDVTINDMESMQAAARKRLLYVEYTRDGIDKRGQLFPQSVKLQAPGGFVSESNYSVGETVTALWFSEDQRSLDSVRWAAHYREFFRLNMTLRCAPAGVDGVIVAHLDPAGGRGQLTNADISPTDGQGTCGMVVNNIPSLLEAVLRGNIYIAYSPRCDQGATSCDYDDVTGRGQFPSFNSESTFIRWWLSW